MKIKLKKSLSLLGLTLIAIIGLFRANDGNYIDNNHYYEKADIAWMIVATALVFLMTPGLAFFYGGMVNRKNVISTMIKSVVAAGVVSLLWVIIGFSLIFGKSINGIIGNPLTYIFFENVNSSAPILFENPNPLSIPLILFAFYQLMFAIITPGLVVGAVAERIRFNSYIVFIGLFSLLIYAPLAHWTWSAEGFLYKMGVLDFAGGTVVHISAGCAALAGAMVLKRRIVHLEQREIPPANIPYVLIGTGLLWFGWFGFNAGSALGANILAVSALATTNIAAASGGLAWMFLDSSRGKKPSVLGFCMGAIVGLVAITPGAGYIGVPQSIFIGMTASIISNLAVFYRSKTRLDDTLDVFPCHGIGGITGMVLTGVFASKTINPNGANGLFYGEYQFFLTQLKGLFIVVFYSFSVSFLIFKFINIFQPIRVSIEDEREGLDATQHNEKYLQGTLLLSEKNNEAYVEHNTSI